VGVAVLGISVGVLVFEQSRHVATAAAASHRLDNAELAARSTLANVAALAAEVERQTAASLSRVQRQRVAGITALVAAAFVVALANGRRAGKPRAPAAIEAGVVARRARLAGEPTTTWAPAQSPAAHASSAPAVDLSVVDGIVANVGRESRHVVPLLHALGRTFGYLPPAALTRLAQVTGATAAQIAGVASFYGQFRTTPRGRRLVRVCCGTACHIVGADRLLHELRRELGIPVGQDTSADGEATIETVGCLGCCTLAPVVQIDATTHGRVRIEEINSLLAWRDSPDAETEAPPRRSLKRWFARRQTTLVRQAEMRNLARPLGDQLQLEIRIGLGSCCIAGGSRDVLTALESELRAQRRPALVKPVGCVGMCHLTPLVEVRAPGAEAIFAAHATPADVRRILRSAPGAASWPARARNRLADLMSPAPRSSAELPPAMGASTCHITSFSHPRVRSFADPQVRIVTEYSGVMDPTSLADYRQHEGMTALQKCLDGWGPSEIIDAIDASGLRGRGGGGFPTGRKWRIVAAAAGEKYLVCNGDEGDPGAFMDRMVMESYPYRVLEGMAIAAFAVSAHRAIVYVRHEYPLAVERLRHAIAEMTAAGWLGPRIAGGDFSLGVEVVEGAGAFVCGEETALLQSLMGHRGTPQYRPPYPAERGLWERPTLINNVETFANVPWIMRHGAEQFARLGTPGSRGTKVFSLAGKVRRGGLIEIPLGLTIRQVVEQIGGGVRDGRQFKAVQIGGPSGGCVPASLTDMPIDYESLRGVGAIMGSGGLVVMDDRDCMVDVARYFVEFTHRESCGHCTFCRLGTRRLLDLLERICRGRGRPRDLEEIESLCASVTAGSLCGLGKTAPNPVLTTLQYFRDEYEAHLHGRCPAGRCKTLIRYEITADCTGCTLCAQHCPVDAISATPYCQHEIDADRCTRCDVCRTTCPEQAIRIV
jgi:NADH:ubiquinone oxidoreductase subunit F (NADH-binding)/NADH:ubiquinone oxidoreductase subunit E/Pyruvate/2-oxoacid:ferredoxin oxidoreductase delta subunit